MKLFTKLLVAPAALGLLAPLSVTATELNSSGIDFYSPTEDEELYFDSGSFNNELASETSTSTTEDFSPFSNFEAGSFSETTVMSGSAQFALASGSGAEAIGDEEALHFAYYYGLSLDTTFTGDDNLNVVIEAGNNPNTAVLGATGLDFGTTSGDGLRVVDLNYARSFGDLNLVVGDSLDISSMFDNACTYTGFHTTLSDCGTGSSAGAAGNVTLSGNYDLGNGFTVGAGVSSVNDAADTAALGLFTKEGQDLYAINLAYGADNYGLAVSYANQGTGLIGGGKTAETTFWGLNGYYSFDSVIDSISVGYETGNPSVGDDTTNWFAGVTTGEFGPGSVNLGVGTVGHTTDTADELLLYEVSYGWSINDSISATLGAFQEERAEGTDDLTGIAATTTFVF